MFGTHRGSFRVPLVDHDDFYRKYAGEVARGRPGVCVCERHRDFGPVVIDLDYRIKDGDDVRRYDKSHIDLFVTICVRALSQWVELPRGGFDAFVMERPRPRVEGGVQKDGVHIVLPEVVTCPLVQLHARRAMLKEAEDLFSPLGYTNPVDDIVDEAVIQRNGWMMYGSSKPGLPPYEVTRVVRVARGATGYSDARLDDAPFRAPADARGVEALVRRLSLRNKEESDACPVLATRVAQVHRELLAEERLALMKRTSAALCTVAPAGPAHAPASPADLDAVVALVAILGDDRAEHYDSWIRVGWCLHSICPSLLATWVEFSRRSAKFEEGVCETLWSHMSTSSHALGVGSLHWWARSDNPQLYREFTQRSLTNLIHKSITGLHHDVAAVVHSMHKDTYACSSIKHNTWHEFRNHRWVECDHANSLRAALSGSAAEAIMREAQRCAAQDTRDVRSDSSSDSSASSSGTETGSRHDRLVGVANKLKTTSFKDSVLKELREMFYVAGFQDRLDTHHHLLGFENGVLDLDARKFRRGYPEDYISLTTGVPYKEFDPTDPRVAEINAFFESVHPEPDIRAFVLKTLASFLHGDVREQHFNIWTGSGSNGKSITIELFEKAFGTYACKVPVALLTQKRGSSAGASPEIVRLKGRRFGCLQEPGNGERLNIGLMKELSGGDTIMARGLYRDPVEFKPQFRLVLTANDLPEVPGNDAGTWRRIRVIYHGSRFVEDPNPAKQNEFKIDHGLSARLSGWAETFMSMLVEYFYDNQDFGNPPPQSVLTNTSSYRTSNNVIDMFVVSCIEIDPDSSLPSQVVYEMYKTFCRGENFTHVMKRPEFIKGLRQHLDCPGHEQVCFNADIAGISAKQTQTLPDPF